MKGYHFSSYKAQAILENQEQITIYLTAAHLSIRDLEQISHLIGKFLPKISTQLRTRQRFSIYLL